MEQKLIEVFKEICNYNDEIIKTQEVTPMIFIIEKDFTMKFVAIPFKDVNEKEMLRAKIMKMIAESNLLAYIAVLDAHMTKMSKKPNDVPEVQEICMRTLYTKDEIVRDWVIHKGKKFIEKFDTSFLDKSENKQQDQWNFWNRTEDVSKEEAKMNKDYFEFRKSNPSLYK